MEILTLIILALLCEAVWETLKMTWQDNKVSIDKIGALLIGLTIAFVTGADLLALVNIPSLVPYVGVVLTGVLISRGSNFIHDFLKKINK